jgi:hypothetical protein
MKIILEYSEKQGCFHFNRGNQQQNTNSYFTLAEIEESKAYRFTEKAYWKFRNGLPTIEIMREYFNEIINFNN